MFYNIEINERESPVLSNVIARFNALNFKDYEDYIKRLSAAVG